MYRNCMRSFWEKNTLFFQITRKLSPYFVWINDKNLPTSSDVHGERPTAADAVNQAHPSLLVYAFKYMPECNLDASSSSTTAKHGFAQLIQEKQ